MNGKSDAQSANSLAISPAMSRLESVFSRGFTLGWLEGTKPHTLVSGLRTSRRGTKAGVILEVRRDAVVALLSDTVRCGDGIVFENEEKPDQSQGGRVFEIFRRRESVKEAESGAKVLLTFANHSIDDRFAAPHQQIWKTADSRKPAAKSPDRGGSPLRPVLLTLRFYAEAGKHLQMTAADSLGGNVTLTSDKILEPAQKHALTAETLREQFSRLGGTAYELAALEADICGKPMVPLSVLGTLRREMIAALDHEHSRKTAYRIEDGVLETLRRKNAVR